MRENKDKNDFNKIILPDSTNNIRFFNSNDNNDNNDIKDFTDDDIKEIKKLQNDL